MATLHRIFRDLDVMALETVLTTWWQSWLPAVQLLVAFGPHLNVALAQQAIREHDELGAAAELLSGLVLAGWIVTGDARFTQKALAEQVVATDGDYVLIVKDNQPTLRADIEALHRELAVVARHRNAEPQLRLSRLPHRTAPPDRQ